jgi:MFS family permease/quinol monooxygenase YgiN
MESSSTPRPPGYVSATGAAEKTIGASDLRAPLRWPVFRGLFIASIASNVGTWMHDVGAAWMMTTLSSSPAVVALVPAAAALPIVLLGLPAGALADVVDRRRLLIATQGWMMVASALLGGLTLAGRVQAPTLIAATLALGIGTALTGPAWQAIVPELVARGELPAALALNGLAINAARAVGPAIGGFIVARYSPATAFLLNAVSFLGVIVVLQGWDRRARPSPLPAETLLGALAAGARYARHAPGLRAVLARAGAFTLCASALWALLPTLVRRTLAGGALDYGILLACIGAGAVMAAFALPRLRAVASPDLQVTLAGVLMAAALGATAFVRGPGPLAGIMVAAGIAWLIAMTALHAAAQTALASWVRGRGLAVLLLTTYAGLAGGSVMWGAVAARAGVEAGFGLAAVGMLAAVAATSGRRLPRGPGHDPLPPCRWPVGGIADDPAHARATVLVTVEYRIDPDSASDFAAAMAEVRAFRLRDGAIRWDLLSDPSQPGRYLESFLVESWTEHLRQHERLTADDRATEERARRFHTGSQPPIVSHYVARELPR